MGERSGDLTSALRAIGGVLLAVGAVVVFVRRSSVGRWSDFELLLTVALPAALLFALAVAGRGGPGRGPADPARAALMVCAVLLSQIALFQFLTWAGASTHHLLYDAAALAGTAAIAIAGSRRAGAPFAIFLAGLALLGTWILLWLKILHPASAQDVRWILLSGGGSLLLLAAAVDVAGATGASELATAGGLGAVAAGLHGAVITLVGAAFAPFAPLPSVSSAFSGDVHPGGGPLPGASGRSGHLTRVVDPFHLPAGQTLGWDLVLLIVSVALVWSGTRSRVRGLCYVGFFGLVGFTISVGGELAHITELHPLRGSLLGWPLILVLLGLAGLAAPLLRRRAP